MAGHLKELRVTLEDRPGSLAKMADALGKAGVNIEAVSGLGGASPDVRILVEDTAKARTALTGAGMTVSGERDMTFVDLDDKPGSLAAATRKLGDQNINIDAIYVVGAAGGKKQLAIGSADATKARAAVKS
ncbi:MAG: ACT domain-containing protein [Chloroflexi bacterium]|nr:ACT domain-containing protein [Chloroflexota bacterium]